MGHIPKEYYLFDCLGVYHKKGVFSLDKVEEAKAAIRESEKTGEFYRGNIGAEVIKRFGIWESHPIFIELANHPEILSLCDFAFGGKDSFRLDHALIIKCTADDRFKGWLHGLSYGKNMTHYFLTQGQQSIESLCWTRVGQLSVAIVLEGQRSNTGGFMYLPGSHKTSYFQAGQAVQKNILKEQQISPGNKDVVIPDLDPGDLVAFPESLIHGQTPLAPGTPDRSFILNMFFPLGIRFLDWSASYAKIREHTSDENRLKILKGLSKDLIHLDPYYNKKSNL